MGWYSGIRWNSDGWEQINHSFANLDSLGFFLCHCCFVYIKKSDVLIGFKINNMIKCYVIYESKLDSKEDKLVFIII